MSWELKIITFYLFEQLQYSSNICKSLYTLIFYFFGIVNIYNTRGIIAVSYKYTYIVLLT